MTRTLQQSPSRCFLLCWAAGIYLKIKPDNITMQHWTFAYLLLARVSPHTSCEMQSIMGYASDQGWGSGTVIHFPLHIHAVPTHHSQLPLPDHTCTLTEVPVLFNLQLPDAVRNHCARWNLHFDVVAFIQGNLERCLKLG